MSEDHTFSAKQLTFLQLFHIAARYDCLCIIDYYCMNEFDHDRVTSLTDDERVRLVELAEREIFAEAIEKGYRPNRVSSEVQYNGLLC